MRCLKSAISSVPCPPKHKLLFDKLQIPQSLLSLLIPVCLLTTHVWYHLFVSAAMNSRSRIRKQLISRNHGFLTSFPSELRSYIYEYVFEDFNHAMLVTHTAASTGDGRPMNASPRMGTNDSIFSNIPSVQLLRCCRQIYREGMGVKLSNDTRRVRGRRLRPWLRKTHERFCGG